MTQLKRLHEDLMRGEMSFGKLPITPSEPDVPIIAVNKWIVKGEPRAMFKRFSFRRKEDRVTFVMELMQREEEVGHGATIVIDGENVTLRLLTKDVDQITELDKEMSEFADSLYYDVVYSSQEQCQT